VKGVSHSKSDIYVEFDKLGTPTEWQAWRLLPAIAVTHRTSHPWGRTQAAAWSCGALIYVANVKGGTSLAVERACSITRPEASHPRRASD